MKILTPSMRLKTNRDTFFLPEPNKGVYFRNNLSSFRMEGSTIDQWVEKLLPMFNGEYSLEDLTKGLPSPHRDRVYEIADVLYRNGYVRDVSQDRPHQLADHVLKKHASQIEFLDCFGDSGAYRFQAYRQSKVLAIGSGPFFVSLVSALIESGLPKCHVIITDSEPTNRNRIYDLVEHARKTDPEIEVVEVPQKQKGAQSWGKVVKSFDSVLCVFQESDIEELRELHSICRDEGKVFLSAICLGQVGLAGPLVHPDNEGCWESAWRRLHQSALGKDKQLHAYSSTAEALLANVIVFEWFKHVTRVNQPEQNNPFYLLDLNTLEGNWHSVIPHPLVTGAISLKWVKVINDRLKPPLNKSQSSELLLFFNQLTSMESGIFHIWEEGDLRQLPLSQCFVQAVDLLSEGPAELLPKISCSGLTHEEARREAGLAGIEAYMARMVDLQLTSLLQYQEVDDRLEETPIFVGVGAGETFAESVIRGLQKCLAEELTKQKHKHTFVASPVQFSSVEDKRCHYYLQTLTTMQGVPKIGLGEEVSGFPVVWIYTNGFWYGSAGLNRTLAFRNALQQALMEVQNNNTYFTTKALKVSSVLLEDRAPLDLTIPSYEETANSELLQSAMEILEHNRKSLLVFEFEMEPILKEKLAGAFGVLLREEESL